MACLRNLARSNLTGCWIKDASPLTNKPLLKHFLSIFDTFKRPYQKQILQYEVRVRNHYQKSWNMLGIGLKGGNWTRTERRVIFFLTPCRKEENKTILCNMTRRAKVGLDLKLVRTNCSWHKSEQNVFTLEHIFFYKYQGNPKSSYSNSAVFSFLTSLNCLNYLI